MVVRSVIPQLVLWATAPRAGDWPPCASFQRLSQIRCCSDSMLDGNGASISKGFDLEECIYQAKHEDEVAECHRRDDEAGEASADAEDETMDTLESELGRACAAALAAGAVLVRSANTDDSLAKAHSALISSLPADAWRWHVDAASGGVVAVVLSDAVDDGSPPARVGVLWRAGELMYATRGGGAFHRPLPEVGDPPENVRPIRAGGASSRHQVLHLPPKGVISEASAASLSAAFESKMPVRVVRSTAAGASGEAGEAGRTSWHGLLDVALGRADVAIVPPRNGMPPSPQRTGRPSSMPSPPEPEPEPDLPPEVLLSLDLLLAESGGVLSGVRNEELDWAAAAAAADDGDDGDAMSAVADAAVTHGLVACEFDSHNFVLALIRPCFRSTNADGSTYVDLTGLSEKVKGFSVDSYD